MIGPACSRLDDLAQIIKKPAMSAQSNGPRVASLYRYPVKGLSGEPLDGVDLAPGATFPGDRVFALENGPSGFDPAAPAWQPKIKFLCLMKHANIAALTTHYDDASGTFTATSQGRTLLETNLVDPDGCAAVERFFQEFMGEHARGKIRLLRAPGHSFSDLARKVVSIINLESVAALGRSIKRDVHPLRFRGNVYIEALPPWSETRLLGRTIDLGSARLRVTKMIQRCAATEVDPETAARDIDVPDALYRLTGEDDCGVYAEVVRAGRIAPGDSLTVTD